MLVHHVDVVVRQGVEPAFLFGKRGGVVDVRGLESRFAQPVGIVRAVDAPVVVLAEDARALVGIGDRIVFEGAFVIAFHGREAAAPPAGAQDAVQLAPGAAGGTTEVESRIHFTETGLKYPDDIKAHFVGFTESIDLMRNKQLDGVWIMAGMPTAAVTEMCSTANGKLVGMDDELIAKVQAKYPWYSKFTIPAGTYDGQPEPVQTTAVKMLLLTDASMPDDVVYDLAKTFWENLDSLGKAHAVMKTVTKEMAVSDLSGIPLHPGAEKYYREIGLLK